MARSSSLVRCNIGCTKPPYWICQLVTFGALCATVYNGDSHNELGQKETVHSPYTQHWSDAVTIPLHWGYGYVGGLCYDGGSGMSHHLREVGTMADHGECVGCDGSEIGGCWTFELRHKDGTIHEVRYCSNCFSLLLAGVNDYAVAWRLLGDSAWNSIK